MTTHLASIISQHSSVADSSNTQTSTKYSLHGTQLISFQPACNDNDSYIASSASGSIAGMSRSNNKQRSKAKKGLASATTSSTLQARVATPSECQVRLKHELQSRFCICILLESHSLSYDLHFKFSKLFHSEASGTCAEFLHTWTHHAVQFSISI